jgi:tryptophanyl-tRNA synthetase
MKILSGIRPTGKLHLGNYIGSVLPAMRYGADVLIDGDVGELYKELSKYFPPHRILLQSKIFNAYVYFKLLHKTPSGLLRHMPQYKVKEQTAHMFTYPVLMAHDLIGYDKVIVGEDQRPHIEFAKDILHKIGKTCPEPIYEGGKIMDLRDPTRKMSKSTPESCL